MLYITFENIGYDRDIQLEIITSHRRPLLSGSYNVLLRPRSKIRFYQKCDVSEVVSPHFYGLRLNGLLDH